MFQFQFPCDADWAVLVNLLGVFASLAVAVVALFSDFIKFKYIYSNALKIDFQENYKEFHVIQRHSSRPQILLYRLKLIQKKKWVDIENCYVRIVNIFVTDEIEIIKKWKLNVGNELKWSSPFVQNFSTNIIGEEWLDFFYINIGAKTLQFAFYDFNNEKNYILKKECVFYVHLEVYSNKLGKQLIIKKLRWDGTIPVYKDKSYNGINIIN